MVQSPWQLVCLLCWLVVILFNPFPTSSDEEGEADDQQGHALPKYPTREIAPPDYQDAMQDMLVSSGGPNHPEVGTK